MRVLVNLLQCHAEHTGTGRYIKNTLAELAALDPVTDYKLLVSRDNRDAYAIAAPNFEQVLVDVGLGRRVRRIAYEQAILPWSIAKYAARDTVLWSPNDVPIVAWPGKQVVTIHDLRRLVLSAEFGLVERTYYRLMMRISAARAARILTVSEHSRQDLRKHYRLAPDKVVVAHNAVDPAIHRVDDPAPLLARLQIATPFLLFVGSQLQIKGPHILVQAYEQIVQRHPRLQLVLVGKSGNATPLIERAARSLPGVRSVPWLPDEDLRCLLSATSAFVFPTLYEGFGIPALEAMACGAPVITSRASCMPEVCGDAALYVDEVTPATLAHAIETLLADANLARALVAAGHRNVQRFTWRQGARQVLDVLHEIAA